MNVRRLAAMAVLSALAVAATACGGGNKSYASVVDKASDAKKLTIGVKFDQPGLGLKNPDGSMSGFDIDVAKYIAKNLGVDEGNITWKETVSANREAFIEQGQVDMVVATYSITDKRKERVSFAGPYFVAGQSLLVRSDSTDITGPESLNGNKKLCSVAGSTPAQYVKDNYAKKVQLQEYPTYSKCVEALLGNQVDAVTTDDIILAGFAAQKPGQLKVVGKPFAPQNYGVGIKKDDKKGRDAINTAIEKMFSDGTWKTLLDKNIGPSGYQYPATPPQLQKY
jgi:glutamate transport system substrate-binding protein